MPLKADQTWGRRHTVLALCFLAVVIGYTDRVNISVAAVAMGEELHWTQTTKGVVLSSFFVGYMLFMVASGWLAMRFGGKRVLAIAVVWWSAFTLLTPLAASISTTALIGARVALGLGEAAIFPATYEMLSRWAPLQERTRAIARLLSGIPLGQVLGLTMTGWIVAIYGWPMAFYAFGAVGFVWAAVWLTRVSDDPAADRRISSQELQLLQPAEPAARRDEKPAWLWLLKKPAIWATVVANFCSNWSLYFFLAWLPSYFREVHQLSIASAGMFSAAPWLTTLLTANLSAVLSDRAIARGVAVIRVRKMTLGIGFGVSAVCLILCRDVTTSWIALLLVCGATGALGLTWSGYAPNVLDLAPRYAPLISGFSNTIATIPGIAGVALTGWIVDTTGTYTAAFALAGCISVGGALLYMAFGSATPIDATTVSPILDRR